MTSIPDGSPWVAAAERIYGPLADAFGLRPARDACKTWWELASAHLAEVIANAQVAGVVAAATFDGMGRLTQRLERLQSEGQAISSPTALLRVGLSEFDGAMHAAMPGTSTACSCGQGRHFGTTDYAELSVPGGHIGTFVGGKAQAVLAPGIADWLEARNRPTKKPRR